MATSRTAKSGSSRTALGTPRRSGLPIAVALVAVLVVVGLFAIYRANTGSATGAASGRYDFGSPGLGAVVPDFLLPNVTAPAAAGGTPATTRLSDYRGKTVLLYFHEGLGCQPCWDQIRDLQKDPAALAAMGADARAAPRSSTTGAPCTALRPSAGARISSDRLVPTNQRSAV